MGHFQPGFQRPLEMISFFGGRKNLIGLGLLEAGQPTGCHRRILCDAFAVAFERNDDESRDAAGEGLE